MPVDFYALGADDDEVGLWTPQNVLDEMTSVDSVAKSLDTLIRSSGKARPEFVANWQSFFDEWSKFYSEHSSGVTAWVSRMMNETMDKVQEYKQRLAAWQDAATKEGLGLAGPGLPGPKGDFNWKLWATVGGIGIAGLLGYTVIQRIVPNLNRKPE